MGVFVFVCACIVEADVLPLQYISIGWLDVNAIFKQLANLWNAYYMHWVCWIYAQIGHFADAIIAWENIRKKILHKKTEFRLEFACISYFCMQ